MFTVFEIIPLHIATDRSLMSSHRHAPSHELKNGVLAEHWDAIQDEAPPASSKNGLSMSGDHFGES